MKKYLNISLSIAFIFIISIFPCAYNAYCVCDDVKGSDAFSYVKQEKEKRMQNISNMGIQMNEYTIDLDDEELERRFDQFSFDRWRVYFSNIDDYGKENAVGIYKDEYKIQDNWKTDWNTRHEFPFAFEYNIAYEKYNASIIASDRNYFLAIEAPSSRNIDSFYTLLDMYDVDYFVKLNSPDEYNEDYFPFWENCEYDDNDNLIIGKNHIKLLSYIWPHRQAGDLNCLYSMATQIYKGNPQNMIAVSCRAGAGRTGTFIAAYMLLDEINYQLSQGVSVDNININIDKVVWELTVQRAFAITHVTQYKNLYRFVDYCLSNIIK